jgi:ring-1,2-phenylacetyl-CoA epoxidase subunit PaaC
MFEPSKYDRELESENVFIGETAMQTRWLEAITPILERAELQLPRLPIKERMYGGRNGYHTEFLQPLLDEMTEVYRLDPAATW